MMSGTKRDGRVKMTSDEVLTFVREHHDPCVTASEVAEEFGVTSEAANYRLQQLRERGNVGEKQAGSSAKVWYPVG
jgi:transposase-like protein